MDTVPDASRFAWSEERASLPSETCPIRVLVIIPSLAVGGAEMDVLRILPALDRSRTQVVVHTFLERGALAEKLSARGIEVVGPLLPQFSRLGRTVRRIQGYLRAMMARHLSNRGRTGRFVLAPMRVAGRVARLLLSPILGLAYVAAVVRLALPIARLIRKERFDIVHTILPNAYLVGACANRLSTRRPLVMSRLSLNVYQRKDRLVGWIERHVLHRRAACSIGNAEAILRELREEGTCPSKLRLVYNGIDIGRFDAEMIERKAARHRLGIADGVFLISSVGNLFPYKGQRDLIEALSLASRHLPFDWLCLIAGRDAAGYQAELQRYAASLGLSRNVRFLGSRNDVPAILSAVDLHVSASHQEGLPNNILEAMCAGAPVLATAVGGVPEMVVDGVTGVLVPPRDAQKLATELLGLATDGVRRRSMGTAGRKHVAAKFSLERTVEALEAIYSELGPHHSCRPGAFSRRNK